MVIQIDKHSHRKFGNERRKKNQHLDMTFIVLVYFLLVFSSYVYFFMVVIIAFINVFMRI